MTQTITITSMSRVPRPQPNRRGFIPLAWFDLDFVGLRLRGCGFIRTPTGGLTIWTPKMDTAEERKSVSIFDERLRKGIVKIAQEVYRSLGGTDGEHDEREYTPEETAAFEERKRKWAKRGESEVTDTIRAAVARHLPAEEEGLRRFIGEGTNA